MNPSGMSYSGIGGVGSFGRHDSLRGKAYPLRERPREGDHAQQNTDAEEAPSMGEGTTNVACPQETRSGEGLGHASPGNDEDWNAFSREGRMRAQAEKSQTNRGEGFEQGGIQRQDD